MTGATTGVWMADDADRADEAQERLLARALAHRKPEPPVTGYCGYCHSPCEGAFCDEGCAGDWDDEQRHRKRLGL